ALRGGGPDNVTVVVADVIDYDYGQTQPILAGAVSGDDDQVAPPNTSAGRASAFNPRRNEAKRVVPQPEEPARPPRSRRRMIIAAALLVLVVLAGLAIGREIVRNNYYVAAHAGTVSIMRGVQGSFLGLALQEPFLSGCLNARNELSLIGAEQSRDRLDCRMLAVNDMRPSERAQVIAGLPSGSLDEAIAQIEQLAHGSVLPVCAPPTPIGTTSVPHSPAPTNSPGVPNSPDNPTESASAPSDATPAPETPRTIAPESPTPPESTSPVPPEQTSPAPPPPSPSPTVTTLPPPPPEPGTNCRELS
ncbi:MAG: family protein phosphatase, partial [Mycobacterium sp.]|nr:family protein phosphatase [Mycobacterium sp.]